MRVVVVGGGVVGLCCAHTLRRARAEVTVVDRGQCGHGASLGNAGWVTPVLSTPIPGPGVMRQALGWMLRPDSPLLVRPRIDPAFARWCWGFWRNCSRERYDHGLRALLQLGGRTLDLFDDLAADGVEFEMHKGGLLFVALTARALEDEERLFRTLAASGYPEEPERFSGDELRELEPALSTKIVGGFHAQRDRRVRPESLVRGLVNWLEEAGVRIVEDAEVGSISRSRSGEWVVSAGKESIHGDRVVVACGAWTANLLRPLGVRLPLEAAKGYSVTALGRGQRPQSALYFLESKVGCSPFNDAVRLAGTLELTGIDLSLNRGRIEAVERTARTYLRDWQPDSAKLEWAGLRPLLPDGLPVIGAVPGLDGLSVATGHGMLGVTLAPATAAALAPLVLEDRLPPELEPFALERFSRGRPRLGYRRRQHPSRETTSA